MKSSHVIMYERFLKVAIANWILTLFIFSNGIVNGEEWALHVEDGETTANQLANRYNLINLGEVLPESNIYHFSLKHENRKKRSSEYISGIHELLKEAPEAKWIEHQTVLKRSKRIPMTREKRQADRNLGRTCVISTLQTTEKEARRCVFPFEYKDKTYLKCTADFSSNGKSWCATEVKSSGEVVNGQWGDCDQESITCYTTKVVVQKESIGKLLPSTGRAPALPTSAQTQRLPVNKSIQRPNLPPPSQKFGQRPFLPPQSSRFPPQISRPGIQSQRLPRPPPRQQLPQGTNIQEIPRQFTGFGRPRPNPSQQQSFEPKVLPPLTGPVNSPRLSQQQILALLNNVRGPPKEEETTVNPPKLEELKTQWNDPKWPEMWFLNRGDDDNGNGLDMNVEEAWRQGVSGKGVVVTILDDGVEWSHPDLEKNYDAAASRDLNDRDADPFPRYDVFNSNKHGTRCAGQVSAAANNCCRCHVEWSEIQLFNFHLGARLRVLER